MFGLVDGDRGLDWMVAAICGFGARVTPWRRIWGLAWQVVRH